MKFLNFLIFYAFSISVGSAQPTFVYKPVPVKYLPSEVKTDNQRNEVLSTLEHPYHLEESLPSGHVKDASIDYTVFLQEGVNQHRDIIFPDFPVLINENGLTLKSDTKVYFPPNSKLIMEPNRANGYEMLAIKNVKNIYIYYPNIEGDKNKHLDSTGEWGFGISIKQSTNITVKYAVITLCQGDGIYIGGSSVPSRNITISSCLVDNNRRNGLSITSGININIDSCVFSNSNGTGPRAGIDIEANNNNNEIDSINISNTITFNNERSGLLINLVNLKKGEKIKNTDIKILNHTDDGSDYGMGLWLASKKKGGKRLQGNISIINSNWINNRIGGLRYFENDINNVNILFKNLKIYNKNNPNSLDIQQIESIKGRYSSSANYKFLN